MRFLRYLQHRLTGNGTSLQVADFVPTTHPIRQWADTLPWAALVAAIDRSFAQRFPKDSLRGRPAVSLRVLLALELLKHEVGASDEQICHRLRTDVAVMGLQALSSENLLSAFSEDSPHRDLSDPISTSRGFPCPLLTPSCSTALRRVKYVPFGMI